MAEEAASKPAGGLHHKLVRVMKACAYVQKDKHNQKQNYAYASDEAFMRKVNGALTDHGVATYPVDMDILEKDFVETSSGARWERIKLKVRFELVDADTGESKIIVGIGEGMDSGDKAISKAQTGARKYAWRLALNIGTGDDPEADETTDEAVAGVRVAQGPTAAPKKPVREAKPAGRSDEPVFKFGKGIQGKSLREGSERQLQWYVDALERSIQDPEKAKWKDSNLREMHAALEALAALHESKMRNEEEYAFEQIPEEAAE